jgi:short-subunit dehydrogenase involved in D-alanine esterification of teichoic acids
MSDGSVIASHPDLDAILLNSGIQRQFDFSNPSSVDMDTVTEEVHTNYCLSGMLATWNGSSPSSWATITFL